MRCHITGCAAEAETELRLRYQHEDRTESHAVWEPLCGPHALNASEGWLPVLSQPRAVRWVAQRPIEDHEHDYRIRSVAPARIGGAVTGSSDIAVCPCGDRRLAE